MFRIFKAAAARAVLTLTQQGLLLVEGAATDTHLLVKRVQELEERQDGSQNTHTHTQIHLYLVLLGVGVIFANPGGPRCPLSEEDPLMMPSKHVRDITRDF